MISQNNLYSDRSQWLMKYKKPMLYSVFISLGAVLFLCNNLSWTSIGIMVVAEVISTLYFLPPVNLRKYGYIKPIIIAIVWVVSTTVVPLIEYKLPVQEHVLFIISQFLFLTVLCFVFDIKDAADDYLNGVNTYANRFGIKATKSISIIILLISSIFLYLYSFDLIVLIPGLITVFLTILSVFFAKENQHQFFYYLWIDGLLFIQGLLFFIAFNVG
jgi:4-hydroxybenzoate polyprenyltransferase